MAQLRGHDTITFTNPTTREKVQARILQEVWAVEPEDFADIAPPSNGWRECAFVAQLAEWPGGERRIRVTYWGRSEGEGPNSWRFLGQYSPSMSLEEFRSLLRKLNSAAW